MTPHERCRRLAAAGTRERAPPQPAPAVGPRGSRMGSTAGVAGTRTAILLIACCLLFSINAAVDVPVNTSGGPEETGTTTSSSSLPPLPAGAPSDSALVAPAAPASAADTSPLPDDAPWLPLPGQEPPAATATAATADQRPEGPRLSAATQRALKLYYLGRLPRAKLNASRAAAAAAAAGTIRTAAWGSYREMLRVPVAGSTVGLPLWGFDGLVTQAAVNQAARVLKPIMDSLQPDIRNRLLSFPGIKVSLFKRPEQTAFDVPEHAFAKGMVRDDVGGLGGTPQVPVSSCDTQNVLEAPTDPYFSESVLVHEFMHAIHTVGLPDCEKSAVRSALDNAKKSGAYTASPPPYILADEFEFFATAATAWFGGVARSDATDGLVNRARIWFKDPSLIKLLRYVFRSDVPQFSYRAVCPNCKTKWPADKTLPLPNESGPKARLMSAAALGLDKCSRPVPLLPGECTNGNGNCKSWAAAGECTKNPGYMLVNCQAACGVCPACTDANGSCWPWARAGECELNPGYMLRSCRQSCAACPMSSSTGLCRDADAACYVNAISGGCGSVAGTCPMSCGRCSKS